MTDDLQTPPSELREPRRELEWHEEMPGLWRGYLLADDGTSLVRCEVQKFFEGRTFPQWSASVSKRCVDLFAGREICETLTRVLDGEPREPECPLDHRDVRAEMKLSGAADDEANFCYRCGASLKGTEASQ